MDLGNDILTRVTHGFDGGPSEQPHPSKTSIGARDPYEYALSTPTAGAQSPSFSSNGELLAFTSTASNLVYGDGNTPIGTSVPNALPDGSDAFVVPRATFNSLPTPQYISPAPETRIEPVWRLGASALSRANGSVLLYVVTPGAGMLRAGASSSVRVSVVSRHRSGHGASRRTKHGANVRVTVLTRTVASASKLVRAGGGELLTLVLNLAKPYAGLAARGGGLSASVNLTFAAAGHATLRYSLPVTFLRTAKPLPSKAARRSKAAHRRRADTRSSKATR